MEEIYDTVYVKRNPIVEGLIEGGTIILSGAAKVGKSFLALQLAYSRSENATTSSDNLQSIDCI